MEYFSATKNNVILFSFFFFFFAICNYMDGLSWKGNGNPLQYSCLENLMDRESWQASFAECCKNLDMTEQLSMNAQVDLEGVMINKMSDKERQIPHCIMYTWNLTKYSNLVNTTKKKQITDKENKLVVTSGEVGQDQGRELRCSNNYVLKML